MKIFWFLLVFCFAGCNQMFPDHSTKFSGVHNGKLMYEIQCRDILHCVGDSARVCEGHPHKVVFQWENDRDTHYMVECQ